MLQQGFGRSPAQNRGLGGDVRLKSGEQLLLFPTAVVVGGVQKTETSAGLDRKKSATRKNIPGIARREIPTCCVAGSALFTMLCYVDAHVVMIMESTCTKLVRRPWVARGV